MKTKIGFMILTLLLQGCAGSFNKHFSRSNVKDALPGATSADEMKVKPYIKYDTAYLGKKVDYSSTRQHLLAKKVAINSYEPTDLNTVLDVLLAQTGVSHRINLDIPGVKDADTGKVNIEAHSINFNGTFEEFMRYVSALYDVKTYLDENNILKIDAYSVYAIKLDFYGENNKFEASLIYPMTQSAVVAWQGNLKLNLNPLFGMTLRTWQKNMFQAACTAYLKMPQL